VGRGLGRAPSLSGSSRMVLVVCCFVFFLFCFCFSAVRSAKNEAPRGRNHRKKGVRQNKRYSWLLAPNKRYSYFKELVVRSAKNETPRGRKHRKKGVRQNKRYSSSSRALTTPTGESRRVNSCSEGLLLAPPPKPHQSQPQL